MLNTELKNQIKKYALEDTSKEFCGLLLSSGDSKFIYKCKNISSNPDVHFEMSQLDYLKAWDCGRNKILAIVHSQVDPKPSTLDILNSRNHKIPSFMYSIAADEVMEITNQHLKYNEYLGREFKIGDFDCFTLLIDFYKKEYGVVIENFIRDDKWLEQNPNIAEELYGKEGFIKIDFKDIIEGNIIEFKFNHFGIYLNGDLLLHHPRMRYSTIERLDNPWKNRIKNCYKYV